MENCPCCGGELRYNDDGSAECEDCAYATGSAQGCPDDEADELEGGTA